MSTGFKILAKTIFVAVAKLAVDKAWPLSPWYFHLKNKSILSLPSEVTLLRRTVSTHIKVICKTCKAKMMVYVIVFADFTKK